MRHCRAIRGTHAPPSSHTRFPIRGGNSYTRLTFTTVTFKAATNSFVSQACPLNPMPQQGQDGANRILEDFSERFSPAIRGVVEFAKRIPGFAMLSQDDQVTLLKVSSFMPPPVPVLTSSSSGGCVRGPARPTGVYV